MNINYYNHVCPSNTQLWKNQASFGQLFRNSMGASEWKLLVVVIFTSKRSHKHGYILLKTSLFWGQWLLAACGVCTQQSDTQLCITQFGGREVLNCVLDKYWRNACLQTILNHAFVFLYWCFFGGGGGGAGLRGWWGVLQSLFVLMAL